jgi:hypothetical protein
MNSRTGRNRRRARARCRGFDSEVVADEREVDSLKAKPESLARRCKKKSQLREVSEKIDRGFHKLHGLTSQRRLLIRGIRVIRGQHFPLSEPTQRGNHIPSNKLS